MSQLTSLLHQYLPESLWRLFWYRPRGILANLRYQFPSRQMRIIGVTGTDGKTTTVTLIYEILRQAGFKVGLISTVESRWLGKSQPTGLHVTSPDAQDLQRVLAQMKRDGVEVVVLEATSHGLSQLRFWGVKFEIGAVTNITRDHFDYHRTYARYLAAKARLFTNLKVAVLNKDDQSWAKLKPVINPEAKLVSYGLQDEVDFNPKKFPFKTQLIGDFNQSNCLAAIAVARSFGVAKKDILKALKEFDGVKGRLQRVKNKKGLKVYVDFAHTPNALEQVLKTLKEKAEGRLIVLFGSAGGRDKGKRPLMGQSAARWADLIVLTADDPRDEPVEKIAEEIAVGARQLGAIELKLPKKGRLKKFDPPGYLIISDRKEALKATFSRLARKGDTVALCGKGHEQSMSINGREIAWDEAKIAQELMS